MLVLVLPGQQAVLEVVELAGWDSIRSLLGRLLYVIPFRCKLTGVVEAAAGSVP